MNRRLLCFALAALHSGRALALTPGPWGASGIAFAPAWVKPLTRRSMSSERVTAGTEGHLCMMVNLEIVPERVEEFLEVARADAEGSRAEPGCLRFDVIPTQPEI
mmetsp:Transcript_28197/g.90140  ORF Transcript_28197/g.90140 Transcript_28197/m.90140 type:complete len:105 (+) Transcript_28197:409-723(+)